MHFTRQVRIKLQNHYTLIHLLTHSDSLLSFYLHVKTAQSQADENQSPSGSSRSHGNGSKRWLLPPENEAAAVFTYAGSHSIHLVLHLFLPCIQPLKVNYF